MREKLRSLFDSLSVPVVQGWYLFLYDFQYRYRLAFFGYWWSVVKPLAAALPLLFVGKHFNLVSEGVGISYEAYALSGLLFWNLFWDAVSMPMLIGRRARKLTMNLGLSDFALPCASLIGILFNFLLTCGVVIAVFLFLKVSVRVTAPLALGVVPIVILAGFCFGLPFIPISTVYQDIRYGIGFIGSFLLWSAPVIHEIPDAGKLHLINTYNPLTYLIKMPRELLFGGAGGTLSTFLIVAGGVLLLFFLSLAFYRRTLRLAHDYVV